MKTMLLLTSILLLSGAGLLRAQPDPAAVCSPPRPVEVGESDHMLEFDGLSRRYLLYVPPGYDPAQAAPLVISLHGLASSPQQQATYSQWNRVADEHGFIVAYPRGTGFPLRWNAGQRFAGQNSADDVGFIAALIDHLAGDLCIDRARVYVNGLSNGGGMSHRIACELAGRVAAVGGVAGAYAPLLECSPARPVPVIAFHGTADRIVPYAGGMVGAISLPPVADWAAGWAARNGCDPQPQALPDVGAVSGIAYEGCEAGAEVVLYTIDGGGHTWPGGGSIAAGLVGAVNRDIDASALMWAFFAAHPLAAD
jgi:polyhydroxybutyrate depolymerase